MIEVCERRIRPEDYDSTKTAVVLCGDTVEDLALNLAKVYAHTRKWDLPTAVYAGAPLDTVPMSVVNALAPLRPPLGDKTATPWLFMPVREQSGWKDTDLLSPYHMFAGISVKAPALMMVNEAYMARYSADDPEMRDDKRRLADRPESIETRMVNCLTTGKEQAVVMHARGELPQLHEGYGFGGTLLSLQRAMIGWNVPFPSHSFETDLVLDALTAEIPYESEGNPFEGVFTGNPVQDSEALLAAIAGRESYPPPSVFAGKNFREYFSFIPEAPDVFFTEDLAEWFGSNLYPGIVFGSTPFSDEFIADTMRVMARRIELANFLGTNPDDAKAFVEPLMKQAVAVMVETGGIDEKLDLLAEMKEQSLYVRSTLMAFSRFILPQNADVPEWLLEMWKRTETPDVTSNPTLEAVSLFMHAWQTAYSDWLAAVSATSNMDASSS